MGLKFLKNIFGGKKSDVKATDEYRNWREMIFSVQPEQVGTKNDEPDRVYGVIMDIGVFDQQKSIKWAISLSAFPTGEASFHPTSGGAVIGLGNIPEVAQAAKEIVEIGQTLWPKTSPTQATVLPEPGIVQFFLLTTNGLRLFSDQFTKIQKQGNPFLELLNRFGILRKNADNMLLESSSKRLEGNKNLPVKALYSLVFSKEKLAPDLLQGVAFVAIDLLEAKSTVFKQLVKEQVNPQTPIEIGLEVLDNIPSSPQDMTITMKKWLLATYHIAFEPGMGENFFFQGVRNPQGKEYTVLLYFDFGS